MMGRSTLINLFILFRLSLAAAAARAERPPETPDLDAERDQLIDKLSRAVEVEASTRRFKALLEERDRRVATSAAAVQKERDARAAEKAYRDAYRATADHEVSGRCVLAADPAHPPPNDASGLHADWGKVVRKEGVRLVPKNALDEGEPLTLYEVAGVRKSYFLLGERFGARRDAPFTAERGDLVLVCAGGSAHNKRLPEPWSQMEVHEYGYATRLAAPPLISKKKKWDPIHITENRFFWAIKDVKWKYPPDGFVLSHLEILEGLGGGRWRIAALNGLDWVMEVPPALAHQELLVPGHAVWAILGQARFDVTLRKLVLVAEDLEDRYIVEAR
jgi:hypothetical protein